MIAGSAWAPPETLGSQSYTRATVWTGEIGTYVAHDLGTLGEEFVWSGASSISEPDAEGNVWVAGGSVNEANTDPRIYRGVLWQVDSAGNVISMTDLEESSNRVDAWDVTVIGNSVFVAGVVREVEGELIEQACIWEAQLDSEENVQVVRTDLPSFTGIPGTIAYRPVAAKAINDSGMSPATDTTPTSSAACFSMKAATRCYPTWGR